MRALLPRAERTAKIILVDGLSDLDHIERSINAVVKRQSQFGGTRATWDSGNSPRRLRGRIGRMLT
jgi:hypothetical protein